MGILEPRTSQVRCVGPTPPQSTVGAVGASRGTPAARKIVLACAAIVALSFWPRGLWPLPGLPVVSWAHLGGAAVLLAAMGRFGPPWREVLGRWAVFLAMLLAVSVSIPLSHALADGWQEMAGVMLRGWLCFTVLMVLTATTPFPELLRGLRTLGVPALLVAVLSFAQRYLELMLEELRRLRRARRARWLSPRREPWLLGASLVGTLFLRSFERAERVHKAMLARGYDGTPG